MVILLDTNIPLIYLLDEEDLYKESIDKIFEMLYKNKFDGCIAFHSLPEMWYVLRKFTSEDERREMLEALCRKIRVVSAPHEDVVDAINQKNFKDFEDCLQDKCAAACDASYIVTGNIKDFKYSEVRALTPDEFVQMMTE